jgi:hypothetical protein
LSSANDFYTYDAAGRTTHIEVPTTNSVHTSVGYDGDGRQVRTDETTWDEQTETEWTETKYYVRSSVLGGQVLTEIFDANAGRTFVYAGEAIIAWQWLSYGWEVVDWEHKDPSGASVRRGGVSQELDPLGGDAGVSAQTQIPEEGLLLSQGSSYSAANPGITYSMNGIRVPADDFMAFAGFELTDILGLVEAYARQRARPELPTDINPEEVDWEQIAIDEALLSGKGIPDLLALLPAFSLAKQLLPQNPTQNPMDTTQTEKMLTQDCLTFLNRILAQLKDPHSNNLLDILKAAKGRLFTRKLSDEEKKKGFGGTHSRVGDPAFYIYLGDAEYANDPYLLIHELFHGAAGSGTSYTHFDMATAAYKVALADPAFMKYANRHGGLKEPKPPDYSPDSKDPEDWYNADVFDRVARHGCTHPIDWNW